MQFVNNTNATLKYFYKVKYIGPHSKKTAREIYVLTLSPNSFSNLITVNSKCAWGINCEGHLISVFHPGTDVHLMDKIIVTTNLKFISTYERGDLGYKPDFSSPNANTEGFFQKNFLWMTMSFKEKLFYIQMFGGQGTLNDAY
jgi:hypothetical protein